MTKLFSFSVDRPKIITGMMLLATICIALVATLPSLWPDTFSSLYPLKVDTDPENMLPADEPVRIFHHKMKDELALYDMLVVGMANEVHPDGVFNPDSLRKIHELTEFAKTLHWPDPNDPESREGVIEVDIIAPSTVDNIEQGGLGAVKFEWLMSSPPATQEQAVAIREKAEAIPFLKGTILSEDGKAVAMYLPLTSKDISHRISTRLQEKIQSFEGDDKFFITGLPVAEDTFGMEMFIQMAISAPLAMLLIFLLLLYFFRNFALILSPMIVAMISVIFTMGILIATGNTVHIMSSMIPIFIMPIAVLDGIHILSEFFDRYQETRDRRKTILGVMDTLSTPMLYTSLTTAVAFSSLALTPIPPVQVFGLFIALGVMVAWILTITFVPASIMFIHPESLKNFGLVLNRESAVDANSFTERLLTGTGRLTFHHAKTVMVITGVVTLIAVYGISKISINDNPVKWFVPSHPIRIADRVLNEHFGGTYMAYLALEAETSPWNPDKYRDSFSKGLENRLKDLEEMVPNTSLVFQAVKKEAVRLAPTASSKKALLEQIDIFTDEQSMAAPENQLEAWDEAMLFLDEERQQDQVFKQPETLRYIATLQDHLLSTDIVGKSNSLADIVKTVHRELLLGKKEEFRIPNSSNAVAQTLITYQNSHRPQDLWHFVTPDYRKTSIWVQLKSGDNRDMSKVLQSIEDFIKSNPPPLGLKHRWFGLTYINVIWQEKMVKGMLNSLIGSFLAVLLMMTILFRSFLWGLLSMVPLTVTIGFIYGVIGLVGKDYDMPVAVLSSLALGLAVDYAIHFLARSRGLYKKYGSWKDTVVPVFGEPARAIARNVVVVGVGFLPLLAASLLPYQTVGILIASILVTAGAASLLILPAMITLLEKRLFPER